MSAPPPTTRFAAPVGTTELGPNVLAPDARELGGLASAAALVALAHAVSLGERLGARWLSGSVGALTQSDALLLVAARFSPWLLGLAVVTVLFALRWLPRMQQRLLEPSVVASWVTVIVAASVAWGAIASGVWPATWLTTTPSTATLLTRFWSADQLWAVGAWLAMSCLLVPLLSELFLRHALLAWLQARGFATWMAVAGTAAVFALGWFVAGVQASPDAALRHGLVALVGGLALGTLAARGARGRGLGLCVLAHGAWMATEAWLLLRGLPAG
jgi:hypothetical protein